MNSSTSFLPLSFPAGASGKEPDCQCKKHKRFEFDPWVGKIPWNRKWQATPVFLPGEVHGQRRLLGYSPWGHKESDTTERLSTLGGGREEGIGEGREIERQRHKKRQKQRKRNQRDIVILANVPGRAHREGKI